MIQVYFNCLKCWFNLSVNVLWLCVNIIGIQFEYHHVIVDVAVAAVWVKLLSLSLLLLLLFCSYVFCFVILGNKIES